MTTATHARSITRDAARMARAEARPHARKLSRDFRTLVVGAEALLRKAQTLSGDSAVAARTGSNKKWPTPERRWKIFVKQQPNAPGTLWMRPPALSAATRGRRLGLPSPQVSCSP